MKGRWELTPRAQIERNGEGPGVLLDTFNASIFLCNEVAWHIVQRLQSGASLGELISSVAKEFEVADTEAQRDALTFLHQLKRMGFADVRG